MKLYTIYYKIQAKHEGKCQYDTQLNNYSRNFSVRQKIFRTDKTNQPVWPNDRPILWQFGTDSYDDDKNNICEDFIDEMTNWSNIFMYSRE
jgi:hypothetical protein